MLPRTPSRNQHESLRGFWWIAEFWPKIVHKETALGQWQRSLCINFGRRRYTAPNPLIHDAVQMRLDETSLGYKPGNLPTTHERVGDRCMAKGAAI